MNSSLKEKAIVLRKSGWSYSIISERLGISKGTLHGWLRFVPYTPNKTVIKRIRCSVDKSRAIKYEKRIQNIAAAHKDSEQELGELTSRDLLLVGLGLYLGEGAKAFEHIQIVNSDPDVIRLAMKWFRQIFGMTNDNFRISVHLYPDSDIKKSLHYWSRVTKVPVRTFGKTQVDIRNNKSQKKRKLLPYGTAHITIRSCGDPTKGVYLHRKIMGYIKVVHNMRV